LEEDASCGTHSRQCLKFQPEKEALMKTYTQLTREQRYQIYALPKMDLTQTKIVKMIGVHESTISRELRRNRGLRGYRPKQAHQLAMSRRGNSKPRIDNTPWALIESLVLQD
jgi:IS30 family transposase